LISKIEQKLMWIDQHIVKNTNADFDKKHHASKNLDSSTGSLSRFFRKGVSKNERKQQDTNFNASIKHTETHTDVIISFNLDPHSTAVPMSQLYDISRDEVLSTRLQVMETAIKGLIDSAVNVPKSTRSRLKCFLRSSQYTLTYLDHGENILWTEYNGARYFRRCIHRNQAPHLSVHFPSSLSTGAA